MAKTKILIVEGVEVRGRALDMILGQIGEFETVLVSTVTDALMKIKAEPFDLVLANTEVSKHGDGLKLAQIILLRNVVAKPPLVIMVTKEKEQELVRKCRQIGVVDYIVYPYDPVNLLKRVSDAFGQHKGMTKAQARRSIAATLKKIIDLPTISQVQDRITDLLASDRSSAADVARVMEIDQSITAKMLRLANSAVFGFNRHVTSVRDAVALIGFEQVADLVTAVSTFEALGRVEESPHFNRLAFWEHSIGCGSIARVIGDKLKVDPERAFVAGLLHDIGKVVLDGYFPEFFGQALQMAAKEGISIYEAETKTIPINHEMVGGYLARQWKLPEPIADVIGAHHTLKPQKSMNMRLVVLVHVVDAQCRALGVGNAGDNSVWEPTNSMLTRLAITRSDLDSWKPEMQEAIKNAQGLLELAE